MTYKGLEYDSRHHQRFVIRAKRDELSVLSGLLANSVRHTAKHPTNEQYRNMCRSMMSFMDRLLKHVDDDEPPTMTNESEH